MKYLTGLILLSSLLVFALQPSYAWYNDCNAADTTRNVGFTTYGRDATSVENENCAFVFMRIKTGENTPTDVDVFKGNFNETLQRSERESSKDVGLEKK